MEQFQPMTRKELDDIKKDLADFLQNYKGSIDRGRKVSDLARAALEKSKAVVEEGDNVGDWPSEHYGEQVTILETAMKQILALFEEKEVSHAEKP